jgi:mannosyltransferase
MSTRRSSSVRPADLQRQRPRRATVAAAADPRVLLGGEVVLALLLGSIALGRRTFWDGESVSVTIAKLAWADFTHVIGTREGNQSLYYLLLRGWLTVAGDSELAARTLSVIAAVATVASLYALARRLASERVALLAGVLLAVNPLFIRYAQQARGYTLVVFLVTLATLLFVRALARPTWTSWLAYAVVAALGVYAHFFALLVLLAHAASLLFLPRDRLPVRKLAGTAAALGTLLIPFVYLLARSDSSGVAWAAENAPGRLFTRIHEHPPLAAAFLAVGLALVIAFFWALRRWYGSSLRSGAAWPWALVLTWLLTPPVVVVLVAVFFRPLFVIRYFAICLPAAVLLVAVALAGLRWRMLAATTAGLLLVTSLAADVQWYTAPQAEDWRGTARYVVGSAHPGDGVLFYPPYVRMPFALYLDKEGTTRSAPLPVYPAGTFGGNEIQYDYYIPVTAARVRYAASRFHRIWLVLGHVRLYGGSDPRHAAVRRGLAQAGFVAGTRRALAGVLVVRYDRAAP